MSDKPEALLLAGQLESGEPVTGSAAAELRRLNAVNQELLEALSDCVAHMHWTQPQGEAALKKAKAAIAKATGEQT